MSDAIEKANEYVVPIIQELGYEVVEITYKKIYSEMNLTFYIYKKEGITLDDCELVNNALEEPLEKYDITSGEPYNLNVSSLGLDRPIITDRDFSRSLDTEIEIILSEPLGKMKKINGLLKEYNGEEIKLLSKGKEILIKKSNTKIIQPYVKI